MKTSRKLLISILTLAVIIFMSLLWYKRFNTDELTGADRRTKLQAQQSKTSPDASSPKSTLAAQEASSRLDPKQVFKALNDASIEFYGRAVDQLGEPVPNASVSGTLIYNDGARAGIAKVETVTDGQGYFQFIGLRGQDLGIGIAKEGYEFRRKASSFSYTHFEADHKRHQPDLHNPVIFTLWKKQNAERLLHYEKVWRFPVNSGPVGIDIENAVTRLSSADFIVTITRTPVQMPYGEQGFAWSALIEVPTGGLIRAGQMDYYNLAPASGYERRFEFAQDAQSIRAAQEGKIRWTWKDSFTDDFFISSRSGKNYAHVNLRIRPNSDRKEGDNEALVAAEIWLNPSGSRNLEFDAQKSIMLPSQ